VRGENGHGEPEDVAFQRGKLTHDFDAVPIAMDSGCDRRVAIPCGALGFSRLTDVVTAGESRASGRDGGPSGVRTIPRGPLDVSPSQLV
jgi:hypothetical protein